MKKILLVALTIFFIFQCLHAQQIPPGLKKKIEGKKNLKAIMQEVEKYYKREEVKKESNLQGSQYKEDEEFENGLLQWKRWEYFNQTRLKQNGDLENIAAKTEAAWRKVNNKYE